MTSAPTQGNGPRSSRFYRTYQGLKRFALDRRITGLNSVVILASLGLFAEFFSDALPGWTKILLLTFAICLSVSVFVVEYHRPLVSSTEDARKELFESFFLPVLCARMREFGPDGSKAELRANITLMKRVLVYPKGLSMKYSFGDYSTAERGLVWNIEQGCCGFAYAEKQPKLYDRVVAHEVQIKMTDVQKDSTESVHCVLSMPIFRTSDRKHSDPVGVLSIDSSRPVEETGLLKKEAWLLLEQFANAAGTLL